MVNVLVPVAYLAALVGALLTFSRIYNKRQARAPRAPYFPRHIERDTYVTLLGLSPPAPDALLKAALIRRAVADVQRIMRIREDKPAMQALLQKGLLGDDLWAALLAAEQEMEAEILEVQHEANTFVEGWGGIIFQTAGALIDSKKFQAVLEAMPKIRADLHEKYGRPPPIPAAQLQQQLLQQQQQQQQAQAQSPAPSAPGTPKTPADRLKARLPPVAAASPPASPLRAPSELLAPPSAMSDGNITSDGEGPRSPSKNKKKKSRK